MRGSERSSCLSRTYEFHCIHNDGPVVVNLDMVNEVRLMEDPKLGPWTRLRMRGSADIEIKEPYEKVVEVVRWFENEDEELVPTERSTV